MIIQELLKKHENLRLKMYLDSLGIPTIGYGFNLRDNPITQKIAQELLDLILTPIISQLSAYPWFTQLNENRQAAIADMAYNMGISNLLQFHRMLQALQERNYQEAASQMLNSLWAKQVGIRAPEDAEIIRTGKSVLDSGTS